MMKQLLQLTDNLTPDADHIVRVNIFDKSESIRVDDLSASACTDGFHVYSAKFGFALDVKIIQENNRTQITVPADSITESGYVIKQISLLPHLLKARTGDDGYFVLPWQTGGICKFDEKESAEHRISVYNKDFLNGTMPMFGMIHGGVATTAIITSGQYNVSIGVDILKDAGTYAAFAEFDIRDYEDEQPLGEDLSVRYICDPRADLSYVHIAKCYREYQIAEQGIRTIRQKEENNPVVSYSIDALPVRLRLAWKPVPGVEPQTIETEPPVKVAIPFKKVAAIADCFKASGIEKVEFCLVGWNCKGHDGRFPQVFPVEESLGGESGLRDVISHVQALGYQITAHDNWFDAYKISEFWNEDAIALMHDGSMLKGGCWAAGQAYCLCPQDAYNRFVTGTAPAVRDLGFRGSHYSDVLTLAAPFKCYNPKHPLTRRECAQWRNKILDFLRTQFGGVSSEGLLDFGVQSIDRALYIEQGEKHFSSVPYIDESVPLLPIVYHGVVSYNLSWETVNCIAKERDAQLRCAEYGAIPQIYFHSAFMSNPEQNWMGTIDLKCETDEELTAAVASAVRQYEMFKDVAELVREQIDDHRIISEMLRATTYSNGKIVLVNYGDEDVIHAGIHISAKSFCIA